MRRLLVVCLFVVGCAAPEGTPATTDSSTSTTTASTTLPQPPTTFTTTPPSTSSTTTTLAPPTTTTTGPPQPTTTRPPSSPTTTGALGAHCRPQMFTSEVRDTLARDYPGQRLTAHVYDTRTGCSYSLNPGNRQNPASVFKIMIMAGTLLEAQKAGRQVTEWEMNQMIPMITESTNPPVRNLWNHFGGSPWFATQGQIFELNQTNVIGDAPGSSWGNTQTSARDQVNLIRQVLLGDWGPLEPEYRAVALDLMTSIVPSQQWGITAGVPTGWTVAQKNGFAGVTTNSAGWVYQPGLHQGYVIAILTRGWADFEAGIAPVERISRIIAEGMTDPDWVAP